MPLDKLIQAQLIGQDAALDLFDIAGFDIAKAERPIGDAQQAVHIKRDAADVVTNTLTPANLIATATVTRDLAMTVVAALTLLTVTVVTSSFHPPLSANLRAAE